MFDCTPRVSGILTRVGLRESPPYRLWPSFVREYPGKS
jgi:hypothetical protein